MAPGDRRRARPQPGGHFIGTIPIAERIVERLRRSPTGLAFGNAIYSVTIADEAVRVAPPPFGACYEFRLDDAVEACPEFLVSFTVFQALAREYGLQLVQLEDFPRLRERLWGDANARRLWKSVTKLDEIRIDEAQWEVISLYQAFAFQRH